MVRAFAHGVMGRREYVYIWCVYVNVFVKVVYVYICEYMKMGICVYI